MNKYIRNMRLDSIGWLTYTFLTLMCLVLFFNVKFDLIVFSKIILISLVYLFFSFTVNNHYDRKGDLNNPQKIKKNPVASGEISVSKSRIQNIFFVSVILLLSFIWFPNSVFIIGILLLNSALYSYMFKRLPIIDLLSHAIFVGAFVIIPLNALGIQILNDQISAVLITLAIFFISNIPEINNQIEDFKPDKKSGFNTTAVYFGLSTAKKILIASKLLLIILVFIFLVTN